MIDEQTKLTAKMLAEEMLRPFKEAYKAQREENKVILDTVQHYMSEVQSVSRLLINLKNRLDKYEGKQNVSPIETDGD